MTRPLLTLVAALLAAPAFAQAPTALPPKDFVEYYSAARVHAGGGDPYDGAQLMPWQVAMMPPGEHTGVVMLWTPPWTLPLYTPFGWLDPNAAHLAWLATQSLLLLLSGLALAAVYGGGRRWAWLVPVGVLLTSFETTRLLVYGQNSALVLAGLSGFLYFRTRKYPFAAGLVGALTAVKPHLLLPFATLLLLVARAPAGGRVLLGGVAALSLGSALALLPNRAIFADFLGAITAPTSETAVAVTDWELPLASYHLRMALDPAQFRWQFRPAALACRGYAAVRVRAASPWDWPARLPLVVLVSLLSAPYGAWVFDLVLLTLPVTATVFLALGTGRAVVVVAAVAIHLVRYAVAAGTPSLGGGWAMTPIALAGFLIVVALARSAYNSSGTRPTDE